MTRPLIRTSPGLAPPAPPRGTRAICAAIPPGPLMVERLKNGEGDRLMAEFSRRILLELLGFGQGDTWVTRCHPAPPGAARRAEGRALTIHSARFWRNRPARAFACAGIAARVGRKTIMIGLIRKAARQAVLGVALVASAVVATAAPAEARDRYRHRGGGDDAAIAIGAGLIGLAVGAAIASDNRRDGYHDRRYYNRGYYPAYRGGYYNSYPVYRGYDRYDRYDRYRKYERKRDRQHRRWHRRHGY